HDLAAEPVCARQRSGALHRAAVLRLAVGRMGAAARRAARGHRQGRLRLSRIAEACGRAARSLSAPAHGPSCPAGIGSSSAFTLPRGTPVNIALWLLAGGILGWVGYAFLGYNADCAKMVPILIGAVGGFFGGKVIA